MITHGLHGHLFVGLLLVVLCIFDSYESENILHAFSYADLEKRRDQSSGDSWKPILPSGIATDFRPLQKCEGSGFPEFQSHLSRLVRDTHDISAFAWSSISLTRLPSLNKTYLLLGGSARKLSGLEDDKAYTPRDGGSVFLCEFEAKYGSSNLMGFGPADTFCHRLRVGNAENGENEFLGLSTTTIEISPESSLIAYCDPLWRANSSVPVGRCFANVLKDGQLGKPKQFSDFCQSGLQVASPCMAGYSLALVSGGVKATQAPKVLEKIQLWLGEPLFIPNGRTQIVTDPFGSAKLITIMPPVSDGSTQMGSKFGSALTEGFITAPAPTDFSVERNRTFAPLFGIQTIVNPTDHSKTFGAVDLMGTVTSGDIWSGVGSSVLRIESKRSTKVTIILGAPFHDLKSGGSPSSGNSSAAEGLANRGRIYLYCTDSSRLRAHSLTKIYDDFLDGPSGSTFFGYSLSRLGDLDGDGYEEFAVGAPDIGNQRGFGQVYVVRLASDCEFDRRPMEVINGPKSASDFGTHLPHQSIDMDFNGLPDLVVPSTGEHNEPLIHMYLSRSKLQADCRFAFPSWLAIRKILAGDKIPVQLTIFLRSHGSSSSSYDPVEQILNAGDSGGLYHQLDSDYNATMPKRFELYGDIKNVVDRNQKSIIVDFDLVAQSDVQEMLDVENGFYIRYRFSQPCIDSAAVLDENGTCPNGGGVKRPLIDWSSCVGRLPVTRFVCYPSTACESDVSVAVEETKGEATLERQTIDSIHSVTMDLVFGEADSSRQELNITIVNHGPTFAGAVRLELQATGNIRIAQLYAYEGLKNFIERRETKLNTLTTANESWVSAYLGTMPAPNGEEIDYESVWFFNLQTYYSDFINHGEETFKQQASINIIVHTGTPDRFIRNNQLDVVYRVVHKPRIHVSYGPKTVFSLLDNRTRPDPWYVAFQRRLDVNELGPRLEHTLQVEYLGPTNSLHNVTFYATVPSELDSVDYRSQPYLVYLFNEIRGMLPSGDSTLNWVDVSPKLSYTDGSPIQDPSASCQIIDEAIVVNPKNLVGMDTTKPHSRTRRHASPVRETYAQRTWLPSEQNANRSSQLVGRGDSISSTPTETNLFRRIPKEILQCDRVGYRLQKPRCAQIVCRLGSLQRKRPVLFSFTGWLWARTLFDQGISDVDVVTTLSVDQGDIPTGVVRASEPVGHFYLAQTFFFPQIRPKLLHQIPRWPIVVGVVLGIIFLSLLVILLYVSGFFKRRKPPLNKARFTKGGADELEQNTDETDALTQHTPSAALSPPSPVDRYDRGLRKKRRGRHRADLTILHPSDLATSQQTSNETQNLLDDSYKSVNNGQLNVGSNEDVSN